MTQGRKFTVVPLANNTSSLVAALHFGVWRQLLMESLVSVHAFTLNVMQTTMEGEFNSHTMQSLTLERCCYIHLLKEGLQH